MLSAFVVKNIKTLQVSPETVLSPSHLPQKMSRQMIYRKKERLQIEIPLLLLQINKAAD